MGSAALISGITHLARAQALLGVLQPLDPGFASGTHNDKLQTALDGVIASNPSLEHHAFAVADLTINSSAPAYAGHRDTEYPRSAASLAKLFPLYGAYQLRSHLRVLSSTLGVSDLSTLASDARVQYSRIGANETNRPWIEKTFAVGGLFGVDFVLQRKTDSDLRTVHAAYASTRKPRSYGLLRTNPSKLDFELQSGGSAIGQLAFREHLRLMAGWSDDVSAAVVIEALGFPYLWGLGVRSGLFRTSWPALTTHDTHAGGAGGLFLGSDYNHSGWVSAPGWSRPPAGAPTMPPVQGGTARSIAFLMTALAQDRLVNDYRSHLEIREMLRMDATLDTLPDRPDRALIGEGMHQAGWSAAQTPWDFTADPPPPTPAPDPKAPLAVSKVGFVVGESISSALLIRTDRPKAAGTVTITAVLVGLNNVSDDQSLLILFGKEMAKKLDEIHHNDP